jgi:hypothetical protein
MPVRSHLRANCARPFCHAIIEATIGAVLLLAAIPATGGRISYLRAQTQSTGVAQGAAQQSSPVGPAAIAAPAGSSAASSSVSSASSVTAPATAAKKVWTNDDVGDLRANSAISTSSGPNARGFRANGAAANGRTAKPYRDQIAKLKAKIPPIDAQIAKLQAAIDGVPTGDGRTSSRPMGVKSDDWRLELQDLQRKREDIQDQIATLEDNARHAGVQPNTLP